MSSQPLTGRLPEDAALRWWVRRPEQTNKRTETTEPQSKHVLHMKYSNLLTISVAVGALLVSPAVSRASILASPHDFHSESWNNDPGDPNAVCSPCHQAHNGDSKVIPLWNHASSQGPWIMYSTLNSPSFKASGTETPINNPGANLPRVSQACLSCHDGTVAVNAYGGIIQGGSPVFLTNSAKIGTDLTHTHPISFNYSPALVGNGPTQDKWLQNPDTTDAITPDGNFVAPNSMKINDFLLGGNNRMECSSCHDVHNQEGTPFDITTNPNLLRINGTKNGVGSTLCRSCHIK